MMGGNPENGWIYNARNPGAFDMTEYKERLFSFVHGLRTFIASAQELTMQEVIGLMCQNLKNGQAIPTTKESENNFRGTYI